MIYVLAGESVVVPRMRNMVTYLTVASLLLGNVAGWVHLGCHSAIQCASVQNAPTPPFHSHGECGHSHTHGHAQNTHEGHNDREPGKPGHSDEHDSDQCSICQGFYNSRDAVVLAEESVDWHVDLIAIDRLQVGHVSYRRAYLSDCSARGPPCRLVRLFVLGGVCRSTTFRIRLKVGCAHGDCP